MIVAMLETATEEDIQGVIERLVQVGFNVHRTTGAIQTVLAGVGKPSHFRSQRLQVTAGRGRRRSHLVAVQAGRPRIPPGGHHHPLSQRCGRGWR